MTVNHAFCTSMMMSAIVAGATVAAKAGEPWINMENQTATRLVSDPSVGSADQQEKDYSWGDLNNNGWIDLVVMRKQPFTTSGRRTNVLFMNEFGVLVDRTQQYAAASNVSGDNGFLTPTNDRDSVIVDVTGDGWRDVVTCTTLSDGQSKHISHPRVYRNLGENGGAWQGLRFENNRIPQLAGLVQSGQHAGWPHAPRFCAVAAGDITGNGFPDLYFGDYDSGGSQTLDFDNRVLINQGVANPGVFVDESTTRMGTYNYGFPHGTRSHLWSAFGAAAVIADMNGNGLMDIVKQTSLNDPLHIAINYNNPNNPGFFTQSWSYQVVYTIQPYFVSVGDLNNNGRLDLVITDDGTDRVMFNRGNLASGAVNWGGASYTLPENSNNPGVGFGSNVIIADLNNNGWNDIIIADVDVDISGYDRYSNIYRNNANPNADGIVTFTRDLGSIPLNMLRGVFDFAVFDINGDGWLDIVAGRSASTQVWMHIPPVGMDFDYPNDRPLLITPLVETELTTEVTATGGDIEEILLVYSINNGEFVTVPMTNLGEGFYKGFLPAVDCETRVNYYIRGTMDGGYSFTDPSNAPGSTFFAVAAEGLDEIFADEFEGDVSSWTVQSHPSLTDGEWVHAVPVATVTGSPPQLASPEGDNSPNPNGMAFITGNCLPGQPAGACDLDGGPTWLISPVFDLSQNDAFIHYDRWFFCSTPNNDNADFLYTDVSNDGGATWTNVHIRSGRNAQWETMSFLVGDYVTPTANVRVRFWSDDTPNNSVTNAVIDNVFVERLVCGSSSVCPADLNGDDVVDVLDMLALFAAWGKNPGHPADLNGDGVVDVLDMLALFAAWGPCP